MRWEDERYVRVYTRDTVDWLALSFEAQGLFLLLLRKVDRAGLLVLGKHGKRGVAAAIGHATRADTIVAALEELMTDGCVLFDGQTLVIPNFIEAQECKSSDAQRKRDQRERDRAKVSESKVSQNVTASVTSVTAGHTESQPVTPNLAVPFLAEPETTTLSAQQPTAVDPVAAMGAIHLEAVALAAEPDRRQPENAGLRVFEHWRQAMGKDGHAKFKGKRKRVVEARLKDGYTPEQLCAAVDGCRLTPFNMGTNDRGQRYDDLELICRDVAHVERFIQHAQAPPSGPPSKGRATNADKDWSKPQPTVETEWGEQLDLRRTS